MSGVAAAFSLPLHFAIRSPTRPVTPRIHSGSRPPCHSQTGTIPAVHVRRAAPPISPFSDLSKVRPFTGRTPPTRPASVHSAGVGGGNPPHRDTLRWGHVPGPSCARFRFDAAVHAAMARPRYGPCLGCGSSRLLRRHSILPAQGNAIPRTAPRQWCSWSWGARAPTDTRWISQHSRLRGMPWRSTRSIKLRGAAPLHPAPSAAGRRSPGAFSPLALPRRVPRGPLRP